MKKDQGSMMMLLMLLTPALILSLLSSAAHASQKNEVSGANQDLLNKTVVITGASSGFGRGVCIKLAQRGANVVIAARRLEALQSLATECGAKTVAVKVDVASPADVKLLEETAISKFGHIDVWINNAGVGAIGRFTDIPMEDEDRVVETNLIGVINGSHCALEQFQKQHYGTLINVSSIVGEVPLGFYATYSASKLGVAGLDKALRAELRAECERKIHICTVLPISTNTPFWQHTANYSGHRPHPPYVGQPDAVINAIAKLILKPQNIVHVGPYAKTAVLLHRLMPTTIETLSAKKIYKEQFSGKFKTENTDGAVLKSGDEQTEVRGNLSEKKN